MVSKKIEFAELDEFGDKTTRLIKEVRGREIAVFKQGDDYYAVLNFCVHVGGPLCEGPVTDQIVPVNEDDWSEGWEYDESKKLVKCPWHSWEFDIETGESTKSSRYQVPTYNVAIENGKLFVEL